ncbi:hypothetical protein SDC9_151955 [bioreactor metagenome]|uniref:DUF1836 domain-containing protein n=1 Tax=bioreactor metagenome TaxID=1076179 RepID=A0A645ETG7_9ZZZZ
MDINTLRDDIDSWEPVKWEGMPDIDLYMDQVVTYLRRQLALFQDDSEASLVTRSIINNYVKDGIVPRPVNKRYAREQISALMMACVLKRVLPMQQVKQLLRPGDQESYAAFSQGLKKALNREAEALEHMEGENLQDLALDYALRAAANCLMADRLLSMAKE